MSGEISQDYKMTLCSEEQREELLESLLDVPEIKEARGELAKDRAIVNHKQDGQACYRIGRCYAHGDGLPQDQMCAWLWYRLAARDCLRAVFALVEMETSEMGEYRLDPYDLYAAALANSQLLSADEDITGSEACEEMLACARAQYLLGLHHATAPDEARRLRAMDYLRAALATAARVPGEPPEFLDEAREALTRLEGMLQCYRVVFHDVAPADRREVAGQIRPYEALVGRYLPLVKTAPDELAGQLHAEFPWMGAVIAHVCGELRGQWLRGDPGLRLTPKLLVGPPGCGKTRFARRLADLCGCPAEIIAAGGSSDNRSLAGSARGWGTTEPSQLVKLIMQEQVANPMMIVDEIDKDGEGRYNGRLTDTLLQLLEPQNAAVFQDECLQGRCDLSRVNWILTANDRTHIDRPLLDRVVVLNVQPPSLEQLLNLAERLYDAQATAYGQDPRMLPPFGQAERAMLRRIAPGGPRAVIRMVQVLARHALEAQFEARTLH